MAKKLKVAVLMGGPSAEHEVSLNTGKVVLGALDKSKYTAQSIIISKTGRWPVSKDSLEADVAFIAMHGTYGEDGTIQGLLEAISIPYTGSGVLASALAMDKERSSSILARGGLKIPEFTVLREGSPVKVPANISYPCVVKPSRCGSSVGVTIVREEKQFAPAVRLARKYDTAVIVQRFIKGDELTCAVIDKSGKTFSLPPTQIIPKAAKFFDYKAKYAVGGSEEVTPPRLSAKIIKEVQDIALKAHHILGCRGMSRTDMISATDGIYVLETNTIPGMTKTSLLPQAAAVAGIPFPELLDHLINSALKK